MITSSRAVAYCRVSTEREAQLESLAHQKTFFEDFSARNGYQLIRIYADEGISGKQMKNRPNFLKLLKDAKQGQFDLVLVKDISRFARNTVDFLSAVRELKGKGIEVVFLSNNQRILGNSEFILTIFSAIAQEESANLSARVKFGKKVNAQKGRVPNIIYGYDQVDTFTLKINELEAQVVRRIFGLYVQNGYGTRKIALELAASGIPTKKGCPCWSPKTIRRILTNPIYMGRLVNNRYETVDFLTGRQILLPAEQHLVHTRPELQIISADLYLRAQEILSKRQKDPCVSSSQPSSRFSCRHLFSTLIRCSHCGRAFCRKPRQSGRAKWKCSGNDQLTSAFCPNCSLIDEGELLQQLGDFLVGLIPNREIFIRDVLQEYQHRVRETQADRKTPLVQQQIKKLETAMEKYKILYASELIGIEELKERLKTLERQHAKLCSQLEPVRPSDREKDLPAIQKMLESADPSERILLKSWTNLDMRHIVEKILVTDKGEVQTFFLS